MEEYNHYNNFEDRQISWLKFNERVLEEAQAPENPLIERLRFLSIVSSNNDEYYMIRVAGVKQEIDLGILHKNSKSGHTPKKLYKILSERSHSLFEKQYQIYENTLEELKDKGIEILSYHELDKVGIKLCNKFCREILQTVLTPIAISAYIPFPNLSNLMLNIAVKLENDSKEIFYGLLPIPKNIDRVIALNNKQFILIEEIIRANLNKFFAGYKILSNTVFRVTRDYDLDFDDDADINDYYESVRKEIRKRKTGSIIRIEIEKNTNQDILNFLTKEFSLLPPSIYQFKHTLDLRFLSNFCNQITHLLPDESFPHFEPGIPDYLKGKPMMEILSKRDILLFHPFQSFDPIVALIWEAAKDPNVLAIKQTIYRLSNISPIVEALKYAAEREKQVTVLLELKASLDEEKNLHWAKELEKSGCNMIFGLPNLKTHSKILLIVRKNKNKVERFVHFGTGNYNDSTAKLYTDISYLTSKKTLCDDAGLFFNYISSFNRVDDYKKIKVAPNDIRSHFSELIDQEIIYHKKYQNGHLIFKMNGITDKHLIMKLYEASSAGVKIELINRGVCCLTPGKKGVSENITVRSIVGRFLEHSRVYFFHQNGKEVIYISSADIMTRNLSRRIEIACPISDDRNKNKIKNILHLYLQDNVKTRINQLGEYTHLKNQEKEFNVQDYLCKHFK